MHVNWGWHGQENGFFDIAVLDPGLYTYDDWQAMYVGLYPNKQDIAIVGDVDGDGAVSASDVTALYNYLLNGDMTHFDTSDVDGDGAVNAADITAIYNLLLGAK